MNAKSKTGTVISQRAFFERADVKALQDVQKRNPYGSAEHKAAFEAMKTLAAAESVNVAEAFGDY